MKKLINNVSAAMRKMNKTVSRIIIIKSSSQCFIHVKKIIFIIKVLNNYINENENASDDLRNNEKKIKEKKKKRAKDEINFNI